MSAVDYSDAPWPVRANFADSQNRYYERLAAPGAWLTGAQRVGVAKEVRKATECSLCKARKAALSPYAVKGEHERDSDLSDVMVEVIHRIITDVSRLTKTWFDKVIDQGLKVEEYVEILATLAHCWGIDEFCRVIGVPPNVLPEPKVGEPSYYRPGQVIEDGDGSWVPMLPMYLETGPEAHLWDGYLDNVIRSISLVPDEIHSILDVVEPFYVPIELINALDASPYGNLTRMQTEAVGTRISAHNDCFY
jgi:hypothetical protein